MRFIIKGKDVTESINNYYFDNRMSLVFIIYNGNNKRYSYQYKDVEILPAAQWRIPPGSNGLSHTPVPC